MIVEIINTGSELMLGHVLNSHHQWLSRRLANLGCTVSRQTTVPDAAPAIEQVVRESLSRADLVLVTGGLGPTADDLTRESVARTLGKSLREDRETLDRIQAFFASRKRPMPERTRLQALVPAGAIILPNAHGTAPGLALEIAPNPFRPEGGRSWLILLPGPRRELPPMFAEQVVPLLRRVFTLDASFVCRILRTTGLGESVVEAKLAKPLRTLVAAGLDLGYCASPGRVDVRLAARGSGAAEQVRKAEAMVRDQLGSDIFGIDNEELEHVVVRLLTERGQTVALAESCTGGCIAHRLTNVPGASVVLRAGWVTYSNESKQTSLGVRAETLGQHGAVSEAVATEMAVGARQAAHADYALAVTGIAGPTGGTAAKPVGTVFIALASSGRTRVRKMLNSWDRLTFKDVTAQQALNELRLSLLGRA